MNIGSRNVSTQLFLRICSRSIMVMLSSSMGLWRPRTGSHICHFCCFSFHARNKVGSPIPNASCPPGWPLRLSLFPPKSKVVFTWSVCGRSPCCKCFPRMSMFTSLAFFVCRRKMGSMNLTQMWEKLVCKDLMVEGCYIYPIYYLISQKYVSYYNYIYRSYISET